MQAHHTCSLTELGAYGGCIQELALPSLHLGASVRSYVGGKDHLEAVSLSHLHGGIAPQDMNPQHDAVQVPSNSLLAPGEHRSADSLAGPVQQLPSGRLAEASCCKQTSERGHRCLSGPVERQLKIQGGLSLQADLYQAPTPSGVPFLLKAYVLEVYTTGESFQAAAFYSSRALSCQTADAVWMIQSQIMSSHNFCVESVCMLHNSPAWIHFIEQLLEPTCAENILLSRYQLLNWQHDLLVQEPIPDSNECMGFIQPAMKEELNDCKPRECCLQYIGLQAFCF